MAGNKVSWQTDTAVDQYSPIASRTSTTQTGAWVRMRAGHELRALFQLGTLAASGTFDFKLEQASDSSGTGAKDLKLGTQITDTGDDQIVKLHADYGDLDLANDFLFARWSYTVAGAAVECSAMLETYFVADPRAIDQESTDVAESV